MYILTMAFVYCDIVEKMSYSQIAKYLLRPLSDSYSSKWRTSSSAYPFLKLTQQLQFATRSTSPDLTTVFHAWPYGRFIEIQSNIRTNKLHTTNQVSNFPGSSFSNRGNVKTPIQLRRETQPQDIKRWFSSRTGLSIFPSIVPVLLDRSNETNWDFQALKSTSHFLPCRSDSSSEANSSCCHRWDAWSHLE